MGHALHMQISDCILHYRILHMCIKINDLIFRLNTSCMKKKYSVTSITSRKFSIASLSDINTDHLRVPGSDWSQDSSSETSASFSSSQSEPAWSWVVLLGSFICLCVLDGISYTFGMLLGKILYCSFRNLWLYKASKNQIQVPLGVQSNHNHQIS